MSVSIFSATFNTGLPLVVICGFIQTGGKKMEQSEVYSRLGDRDCHSQEFGRPETSFPSLLWESHGVTHRFPPRFLARAAARARLTFGLCQRSICFLSGIKLGPAEMFMSHY